jgi:SAM-dependent methyltransferase
MSGKQPKLILRESCIDDVVRDWPVGSVLEMGAGTGRMTRLFLDRGYRGAAYDLGADSREAMRRYLASAGDAITIFDDPTELGARRFDYLLAFEVLEHIENDLAALMQWTSHVREGGRVLLSVPAHARKFGRSDEIVGHVRRDEKAELERLLRDAGYEDVRILNYGFPITGLTRRLSNRLIRGDRSYENLSMEQRSIASARRKPKVIDRVLAMFGGAAFGPFRIVQRWFYRFDWGDGYVATAVKSGNAKG